MVVWLATYMCIPVPHCADWSSIKVFLQQGGGKVNNTCPSNDLERQRFSHQCGMHYTRKLNHRKLLRPDPYKTIECTEMIYADPVPLPMTFRNEGEVPLLHGSRPQYGPFRNCIVSSNTYFQSLPTVLCT